MMLYGEEISLTPAANSVEILLSYLALTAVRVACR